ncbi:MAG TPA: formyltransferase family protein [Anaerolineaceae bacterium]
MRIFLIGTSSKFTWQALQAITDKHTLAGIAESGKGIEISPYHSGLSRLTARVRFMTGIPILWEFARQNQIPYFFLTRQKLPAFEDFLGEIKPDLVVVASMNQLIPDRFLKLAPLGFINVHPSLLPKYRGPNAWFWQIYAMETESGITIHQIDPGEDTGDILAQQSFPVLRGIDGEEFLQKSIALIKPILAETLDLLSAGLLSPRPQRNLPCPLRARRLEAGDQIFLWQEWSLERTYHFLRGAYPWYDILTRQYGLGGYLEWRAVGFEKHAGGKHPGKIHLDRHGFYFAHPDGKIRIRPRLVTWRALVLAALLLAILNLLISR